MKFLIRRIRYAFAGHMMRGIFAIVSLLAVVGFIVLMLSGVINQRALFEKIFGFAWNSSKGIAEDVDANGIPLDISDQGIYFKDSAPEGAQVYDSIPTGTDEERNSANTSEENVSGSSTDEKDDKNSKDSDKNEDESKSDEKSSKKDSKEKKSSSKKDKSSKNK